MLAQNLIKYGYDVNDIVEMHREWCPICAKQRWHEAYEKEAICVACLNIVPFTSKNTEENNG